MTKNIILGAFACILLAISACDTTSALQKLNLFPVSQDKQLGLQVNDQILNEPSKYPVMPESKNPELYRYVRGITDKILNTGKVQYREDFAWEVRIIEDHEVLNAFCTPGGYIYVYTGLIKYLDSEDQLAGVMGHEIAHAALRHSTRQMTNAYGLNALSQLALGSSNPGMLAQVAQNLVSLKFGRNHETEADTHSVIYLCGTEYNAAGAAGFFEKLTASGSSSSQPAFLSTHPDPGNRVKNIHDKAKELGCTSGKTFHERYAQMKATIR